MHFLFAVICNFPLDQSYRFHMAISKPSCMTVIVRSPAICVVSRLSSSGSHPLLAQVPLTVSPFISLPSAVTLPYTYKSVPPALPPSITSDLNSTNSGETPKYIVSASGHAAHPDEIIAACKSLQHHLHQSKLDAAQILQDWEASIKARDLAEKRRVAPGWLDRDEKILEPTKAVKPETRKNLLAGTTPEHESPIANANMPNAIAVSREGEELDRAFGALDVR